MSGITLEEVPRPKCGKAVGSGNPAPPEPVVNRAETIAREAARQLDHIALAWSLRS
jgi:hypothetical protein